MHLKSRTAKLVLSLGLPILASGVLASEIYRYTDEDGNVHFTDRPTGQGDEQRVAIDSQPTDSAAVQQRFNERYGKSDDTGAGSSNAETDDEEERQPTRAERQQAAAERRQECERLRGRLGGGRTGRCHRNQDYSRTQKR